MVVVMLLSGQVFAHQGHSVWYQVPDPGDVYLHQTDTDALRERAESNCDTLRQHHLLAMSRKPPRG